jgi:hypothetical protein
MTRVEYPWHRCVPGASFFVPSLEPHRTKVEGLRQGYLALGNRAAITARPGMYRGMLGVMFSVRSAPQPRGTS